MDNETTTAVVVLIVLVVAWIAIGLIMRKRISSSIKRSWKNHWLILPFKIGAFSYPATFFFIFNIGVLIDNLTDNGLSDRPILEILFVFLLIAGMGVSALISHELK